MQAFKKRQVPQMKIVGSNFPLTRQTRILSATDVAPHTSTGPTHFVITQARVVADTSPGSAAVRTLNPGTAVTLVKTELGWSLVAREGRSLGYVATTDLIPIQ